MQTPGIYQIRNKITAKVYIGSSTKCLKARLRNHLTMLERAIHPNRHLMGAWQVWGADNFAFEAVEFVDEPSHILEREQFHIDRTHSYDPKYGYNLAPNAGNCAGVKHGPEGRKNIGAAARARFAKMSAEEKAAMAAHLPRIDEIVAKLGRHPCQGYRHTDKARAAMVKARLGVPIPSRQGIKQRPETIAKRTAALTGLPRLKLRKITDGQLTVMRQLKEQGLSYQTIANRYGLSLVGVYSAVKGITHAEQGQWQDNPQRLKDNMQRGNKAHRKLARAQVQCVRTFRELGVTFSRLAKWFGSSMSSINRIVSGQNYQDWLEPEGGK